MNDYYQQLSQAQLDYTLKALTEQGTISEWLGVTLLIPGTTYPKPDVFILKEKIVDLETRIIDLEEKLK